MNGLYEMREQAGLFKKNEPKIHANERISNNRAPSSIRALKPVFAPFASSAMRLIYASQRARITQRGEQ